MSESDVVFFELESEAMKMVPINSLYVTPGGVNSWNLGRPSWRLELESGSYIKLSRVVYGESIPGFESTLAEALRPNIHYLVLVSGAGFAKGLEFYMSESKPVGGCCMLARLRKIIPILLVNRQLADKGGKCHSSDDSICFDDRAR
jgi:hypothetical protein